MTLTRLSLLLGNSLIFGLLAGLSWASPEPQTAASGSSRTQSTAQQDPVRQAQMKFVREYVEAIRSKDIHRFEQTFHPTFRECISPETQAFFDFLFSRQDPPNTGYRITSIKPEDPKQPTAAGFLPPEGFTFPVRPTHTIQIDFDPTKDGTSLYSSILSVAPDHGGWYWVGPCPNAKGMELFRERMKAQEQQKAEAKKLASEIKDPLLGEIQDLLRKGQKVQAIKKYSAATGKDLTTSFQVVDLVEAGGDKL